MLCNLFLLFPNKCTLCNKYRQPGKNQNKAKRVLENSIYMAAFIYFSLWIKLKKILRHNINMRHQFQFWTTQFDPQFNRIFSFTKLRFNSVWKRLTVLRTCWVLSLNKRLWMNAKVNKNTAKCILKY